MGNTERTKNVHEAMRIPLARVSTTVIPLFGALSVPLAKRYAKSAYSVGPSTRSTRSAKNALARMGFNQRAYLMLSIASVSSSAVMSIPAFFQLLKAIVVGGKHTRQLIHLNLLRFCLSARCSTSAIGREEASMLREANTGLWVDRVTCCLGACA